MLLHHQSQAPSAFPQDICPPGLGHPAQALISRKTDGWLLEWTVGQGWGVLLPPGSFLPGHQSPLITAGRELFVS